jgi:hypothetical protein
MRTRDGEKGAPKKKRKTEGREEPVRVADGILTNGCTLEKRPRENLLRDCRKKNKAAGRMRNRHVVVLVCVEIHWFSWCI